MSEPHSLAAPIPYRVANRISSGCRLQSNLSAALKVKEMRKARPLSPMLCVLPGGRGQRLWANKEASLISHSGIYAGG